MMVEEVMALPLGNGLVEAATVNVGFSFPRGVVTTFEPLLLLRLLLAAPVATNDADVVATIVHTSTFGYPYIKRTSVHFVLVD